jgi:hypothetical protein
MRARSRAKIRFVLGFFLLLGLIIQTAYASICDVDGDNDFDRASIIRLIRAGGSRAVGRSDPADADVDGVLRDLDPGISPTGWTQDLWKFRSDPVENAHPHQALPTRKTLTRNGSTFDKPDGDSLSFLRSTVSPPATNDKPPQNPTRAIPAFALEPPSTYAVHYQRPALISAAAICGGSSRVIRSPGVARRAKRVHELRLRYRGKAHPLGMGRGNSRGKRLALSLRG